MKVIIAALSLVLIATNANALDIKFGHQANTAGPHECVRVPSDKLNFRYYYWDDMFSIRPITMRLLAYNCATQKITQTLLRKSISLGSVAVGTFKLNKPGNYAFLSVVNGQFVATNAPRLKMPSRSRHCYARCISRQPDCNLCLKPSV